MTFVFLDHESRKDLRAYKDDCKPELELILFESDDDYKNSEALDQSDLDEEYCSDVESSGEDFFEDYVPKVFPPIQFDPQKGMTEAEKKQKAE